jgi:hypothetical protein
MTRVGVMGHMRLLRDATEMRPWPDTHAPAVREGSAASEAQQTLA